MEKGKKKLFLFFGFIIFLCLGVLGIVLLNKIFNTYENRDIKDLGKWEESIHVYEEVEDITERSEVFYDNLIFLYNIHFYTITGEIKDIYLSVFSTGDVYSFECSFDFILSGFYITEDNYVAFDDSNWTNTQNVIYLGQLSNRETLQLQHYIKNFDINEKELGAGKNESDIENLLEERDSYQVVSGTITMYWRDQSEEYTRQIYGAYTIQMYGIYFLDNDIYESIDAQNYNENVLAAMELIKTSGFYNRWIDIFLENYKEILFQYPDPRVETGFEYDNEMEHGNGIDTYN